MGGDRYGYIIECSILWICSLAITNIEYDDDINHS
jgi:hypothetical protein